MHSKTLISLLVLVTAVNAYTPAGSNESISNLRSKIKNVVVMVMENRSLDNLLGGQTTKGLDNPINNGPFCNPIKLANSSSGQACSGSSDYNSVVDDPDHFMWGNNLEFYGTFNPNNTEISEGKLAPTLQGFVQEQIRLYGGSANESVLATQVMHYYTEAQVPVLTALTKNFVVFNHWHSDIPSSTNPNRVALTSGTSAGKGENGFNYNTMSQRSIFQQVSESNLTWKDYQVDTSIQDARWYTWTYASNSTHLIQYMDSFYADAANGTLSNFTCINPSSCGMGTNSMHPSGLISDGETLIKDVYEALRASPKWESTLFIITFDETGGFHDHVPPPLAPRPDKLTYDKVTPDGSTYHFEFDRPGGRLPTWVISPWVSAQVEQKGINSDGQVVLYSATSILRTLGHL